MCGVHQISSGMNHRLAVDPVPPVSVMKRQSLGRVNLSASKYNSFPKEVWELSDKKISTVYLCACFCFVCLSLDLILFLFVFFIYKILDWPHKNDML